MAISHPNWLELPEDLTLDILRRCTGVEITVKRSGVGEIPWNIDRVCRAWRMICKGPYLSKSIHVSNKGDDWDKVYKDEAVKLIKNVVNRDCAKLVNINFEYFATDDLLYYISRRASQLRRLRIGYCCKISNLARAAKNLPLLEELDIYGFISDEDLYGVGRYCPNLKILKYNNRGLKKNYGGGARTIAETMPGLVHLQLIENGNLASDGLEAILNSCLQLESLDLRCCSLFLPRGGVLEKQCLKQIKHFRGPHDSMEDYVHPLVDPIGDLQEEYWWLEDFFY